MPGRVPSAAARVPEDLSLVDDAHNPVVGDVLGARGCGHVQSQTPCREDIFSNNLTGIAGRPAVDVPDDCIGDAVSRVMQQLEDDLPAAHHGLHQVIPAGIPDPWQVSGRFSHSDFMMTPFMNERLQGHRPS